MAKNGKNRLAILTIFRFCQTDVNFYYDSYVIFKNKDAWNVAIFILMLYPD